MNELCLMTIHAKHSDTLQHHGVQGMKWGVRRYQPYPSDYVGKGKYVGKSSTQSGEKPTAREALRNKAKSWHASARGSNLSQERRFANRAQRWHSHVQKRAQRKYDRAVKKGNEAEIAERALRLDTENKVQESLKKLQQDYTNRIQAAFAVGKKNSNIVYGLNKINSVVRDFFNDFPVIPVMSLGSFIGSQSSRRAVQSAIEESNILGKTLDEVIQDNLKTAMADQRVQGALFGGGYY